MNMNEMRIETDELLDVDEFIHVLTDEEFNQTFIPITADEVNNNERDIVKDAVRDCMDDVKLCISNVEEMKLVTYIDAETRE